MLLQSASRAGHIFLLPVSAGISHYKVALVLPPSLLSLSVLIQWNNLELCGTATIAFKAFFHQDCLVYISL